MSLHYLADLFLCLFHAPDIGEPLRWHITNRLGRSRCRAGEKWNPLVRPARNRENISGESDRWRVRAELRLRIRSEAGTPFACWRSTSNNVDASFQRKVSLPLLRSNCS
jgi:hypothetical protein